MSEMKLESRVAVLEAEILDLRERLERAEAIAGIKRGMEAAEAGKYRPAREVLEDMKKKYVVGAK